MRLSVLAAALLASGCGPGSGPAAVGTPTPTATSTPAARATPTPSSTAATPSSEAREQLRNCKTNLKNLATAYEMYSTDFYGRYPSSPGQLTPNYLRVLPACPTNDQAYRIESTGATPPDAYTMWCQGSHPDLAREYPRYTSVQGLLERP